MSKIQLEFPVIRMRWHDKSIRIVNEFLYQNFFLNDYIEELWRFSPVEFYKNIIPSTTCLDCIQICDSKLKACQFSNLCPTRIHFGNTSNQELKVEVYIVQKQKNGEIRLVRNSIGLQQLMFLVAYNNYKTSLPFFVNWHSFGIIIHHLNQVFINNNGWNITGTLKGDHSFSKDYHEFDNECCDIRGMIKEIGDYKIKINKLLSENEIRIDPADKKIPTGYKTQAIENLFLTFLVDFDYNESKNMLVVLKENHAEDIYNEIKREFEALRRRRIDLRKNINRTEKTNRKAYFYEPDVIEVINRVIELITPKMEQIIKNGEKPGPGLNNSILLFNEEPNAIQNLPKLVVRQ